MACITFNLAWHSAIKSTQCYHHFHCYVTFAIKIHWPHSSENDGKERERGILEIFYSIKGKITTCAKTFAENCRLKDLIR